MKFKKAVEKWLKGELSNKQLAKKLGEDGVRKLEERVFDAIREKHGAVPEVKTLQ